MYVIEGNQILKFHLKQLRYLSKKSVKYGK
ncbi:hypothetical protein SAMN05444376_1397 [Bacteroides clarus YIT 12056]|nr:hypothetical protein SAMN05444376_1397 [Bacteroides clarus YIT 12056]